MPDETGTPAEAVTRRAVSLADQGCLDEAAGLLASLCRAGCDDAEAWFWRGRIDGRRGRFDAALQYSRRAVELRPDYGAAHVSVGKALVMLGQPAAALPSYRTALELDPDDADAYTSLGFALVRLDRPVEAAACYEAAARLQPLSADAHYNVGNVRAVQRRYAAAAAAFYEALRLAPDSAAAHNNLGAVLFKQDMTPDALVQYELALQIDPGYAEAHTNLATALLSLGRVGEAQERFNTALRLRPDLVEAHAGLAAVYTWQGDAVQAVECHRRAVALAPPRADLHSTLLLTLCYLPECTLDFMWGAAREWQERHAAPLPVCPPRAPAPGRGRRLRIGYVSGDFRSHPVGYFIGQVLEHHDRDAYEVYCYYNEVSIDTQTEHLKTRCEHWRDVAGTADEALVEQIRRDGIDILVDLAGHTGHNRLRVFARRPAPLQVTWMGYFATTGVAAIDYVIADRWVIPPQHEDRYSERVVRLPHSYLCFRPPSSGPAADPPPAAAGGGVTFGCFNNQAKVTPEVVACWSRLLLQVPDSRLLMKYRGLDAPAVQHRYRELFAGHGVAPERLRLMGYSPREEFLAAYREVDIALDPFPYNGGITTMEALWMGVPVITLRGDRFIGLVGESLLRSAGLDEFITASQHEYIDTAVRLAGDLPRLRRLREGLPGRVAASPLCDGAAYTAAAERLFQGMWAKWCEDTPG